MGDSAKQSGLSWWAANTSTADENTTKTRTAPGEIVPVGNSRTAVLGFAASIFRSTNRLNPIAALRAPIIATAIHRICEGRTSVPSIASATPLNANGSAKRLWENFIILPYVKARFSKVMIFKLSANAGEPCYSETTLSLACFSPLPVPSPHPRSPALHPENARARRNTGRPEARTPLRCNGDWCKGIRFRHWHIPPAKCHAHPVHP